LADTNGRVSSPVKSGTEDDLTQPYDPSTTTPIAERRLKDKSQAGAVKKPTRRLRRNKVGEDADPNKMNEDKRTFFQNAWGDKVKAKAEANGKAKAKNKPKAKAKEKPKAKGPSIAGLRILIQSNKEGYLYCDLPLFLPIANAAGDSEADVARGFKAGVTVDTTGHLWLVVSWRCGTWPAKSSSGGQ
jgi:hypothetical protein